jgi:hypothetical protein
MVRGCPALVLATSVLAGCISQTTVIRVRTDGSGTLTQTIAVRSETARMLRDMRRGHEQGRSNQPPAPRGDELFPESQARALATELGKDVTFLSSEPLKMRDVEGIKASYAFRDLEALRVVQEPSPPGFAEMPAPDLGGPASGRQPLTFRFDRRADGHAVVTVVFPPPMGTSDAEASEAGGEPGGAGPLTTQTQLLKGLRITVVLEVDGTLLSTNSPYAQGSSVTITDVDFDVLLADSKLLWRLKGATDLETAKWVLKDIKGMKVHLDPVTVEFAAK